MATASSLLSLPTCLCPLHMLPHGSKTEIHTHPLLSQAPRYLCCEVWIHHITQRPSSMCSPRSQTSPTLPKLQEHWTTLSLLPKSASSHFVALGSCFLFQEVQPPFSYLLNLQGSPEMLPPGESPQDTDEFFLLSVPKSVCLSYLWLWWPWPFLIVWKLSLLCSLSLWPFTSFTSSKLLAHLTLSWLVLPEGLLIGCSFFSCWFLLLPLLVLNSCISSFVRSTHPLFTVPTIHRWMSRLLSSHCTQLDLTYLSSSPPPPIHLAHTQTPSPVAPPFPGSCILGSCNVISYLLGSFLFSGRFYKSGDSTWLGDCSWQCLAYVRVQKLLTVWVTLTWLLSGLIRTDNVCKATSMSPGSQ